MYPCGKARTLYTLSRTKHKLARKYGPEQDYNTLNCMAAKQWSQKLLQRKFSLIPGISSGKLFFSLLGGQGQDTVSWWSGLSPSALYHIPHEKDIRNTVTQPVHPQVFFICTKKASSICCQYNNVIDCYMSLMLT